MRVRGNCSPNPLTIEPYNPLPGCVEVRLRENINEVQVEDEMREEPATLY